MIYSKTLDERTLILRILRQKSSGMYHLNENLPQPEISISFLIYSWYFIWTPCIKYAYARWRRAFSLSYIPNLGEAHPHSQWAFAFQVRMCISGQSFPVRSMAIPGKKHPHSWRRCAFSVSHIVIPGEDVFPFVIHPHQEWGCASVGMGIWLTGNAHPDREWACASQGMRIVLQGNKSKEIFRILCNYF